MGPSGCGKTTTLRMVNRMLEPTSGRITWDGTALRSKRKTTLRRQMGYVIQSGGLFPHRTVLENIGTVPGLLRWSADKTRKRSLELLDSVGLDRKLAHRYPAQLSGGQQQRVGVARALAADPMVMLMDEPFSAVDPVVRSELHEFFLGLQRELSKTIILITHDIDEAIKLGDQVAILRVGGRLAQVGTPQQLLDEPADAFVEGFVGRDRGYRSLSFLPAGGLSLDSVKVVRDAEVGGTGGPTLVVDGEARPIGWADPARPGQLLPLGSTFDPSTDTLRSALDSALTSPYGLGVAVEGQHGRFAGVASAATILGQVEHARAGGLGSVSVLAADPDPSSAGGGGPPGSDQHETEDPDTAYAAGGSVAAGDDLLDQGAGSGPAPEETAPTELPPVEPARPPGPNPARTTTKPTTRRTRPIPRARSRTAPSWTAPVSTAPIRTAPLWTAPLDGTALDGTELDGTAELDGTDPAGENEDDDLTIVRSDTGERW